MFYILYMSCSQSEFIILLCRDVSIYCILFFVCASYSTPKHYDDLPSENFWHCTARLAILTCCWSNMYSISQHPFSLIFQVPQCNINRWTFVLELLYLPGETMHSKIDEDFFVALNFACKLKESF